MKIKESYIQAANPDVIKASCEISGFKIENKNGEGERFFLILKLLKNGTLERNSAFCEESTF